MPMIIFAALTFTAASFGVASMANAGGFGWGCRTCGYSNGTQLTGIVIKAPTAQSAGAVILPSGEKVDLR